MIDNKTLDKWLKEEDEFLSSRLGNPGDGAKRLKIVLESLKQERAARLELKKIIPRATHALSIAYEDCADLYYANTLKEIQEQIKRHDEIMGETEAGNE